MVRKSFLEIQIEALGQMMARILLLRRKGDRKGVQTEIHVSAQRLAGMEIDAMRRLTDDSLIGLFTPADGLDAGKCLLAGALLREEAEVLDDEGDAAGAASTRRKALRLYLEALIANEYLRTREYPREAEALLERVDELRPTAALSRVIYRYHEAMGDYDRAEDRLFELREIGDPDWQAEAEAFFRRLLMLDDERLEAGGLSREEVEEGLEEVTRDA